MVRNDLDRRLAEVKRSGRKALIGYLAAGYPRFAEQKSLIAGMVEEGLDVLELGIPFSDPIADGPTIQYASQESLRHGTTLRKILAFTAGLKTSIGIPIVYMSYLNPILCYGVDKFARDARRAGVDGLIVPDLIPEESGEIAGPLRRNSIHLIHLVAPTTPFARQSSIARRSGGFLYAVSVAGVTGARRALPPETRGWLGRLQKESRVPVCVGFGISGPEQIRALRGSVDGFIVGSAIIDLIRKNHPQKRQALMRRFVSALSKECRRGR